MQFFAALALAVATVSALPADLTVEQARELADPSLLREGYYMDPFGGYHRVNEGLINQQIALNSGRPGVFIPARTGSTAGDAFARLGKY